MPPTSELHCRDLTETDYIRIKGQMKCMGGAPEFMPSEGSNDTQLSSILDKTETTISVGWSGGGQTKCGMYMRSL